jgi:uncharacterized protein (DUF2062 family)
LPRKFFRKYLPRPEEILAKPWAAPFRPWLAHPNLWHLNRRSVPAAVAIGLFCGLIPGPLQMLGAVGLCLLLKRNIPVALVTTLYTNPITIVPLYVLAYGYGRLLLGDRGPEHAIKPYEWDWSMAGLWEWMLSLGKPLALGLPALALTLAVLGYFVTELGWRAHVVLAWRARARKIRARGRP